MAVQGNANLDAPKTVDELAKQLQNTKYGEKTNDELRTEAENMYKNQLEQSKLSAQQSYDSTALELNNQLTELNKSYDKQYQQQQQATVQSKQNADLQALSRGMQRSTYNNATLANLDVAGNKALGQIEQNRTDSTNEVNSQLALLQKQLQENLSSAQSTYENNVISKLQELLDQQYTRQQQYESTSNDLAFKLYELQKAAAASSSSSGGSRSTSSSATKTTTTPTAAVTTPAKYDLSFLNGNGTNTTTPQIVKSDWLWRNSSAAYKANILSKLK